MRSRRQSRSLILHPFFPPPFSLFLKLKKQKTFVFKQKEGFRRGKFNKENSVCNCAIFLVWTKTSAVQIKSAANKKVVSHAG